VDNERLRAEAINVCGESSLHQCGGANFARELLDASSPISELRGLQTRASQRCVF
jgi:hypothetical protein